MISKEKAGKRLLFMRPSHPPKSPSEQSHGHPGGRGGGGGGGVPSGAIVDANGNTITDQNGNFVTIG